MNTAIAGTVTRSGQQTHALGCGEVDEGDVDGWRAVSKVLGNPGGEAGWQQRRRKALRSRISSERS